MNTQQITRELALTGREPAPVHDPGFTSCRTGETAGLVCAPPRPVIELARPQHESMTGPGQCGDIRVLIVDDCALYRECLVGVLAVASGALVAGVAWDLSSLTAGIQTVVPHVILLNMATRDSAVLLREALSSSPNTRVVVIGVSEDDEAGIVACAEAGAAGYHLRTESLDELIVLIHKVAAGESFCSPQGFGDPAQAPLDVGLTTAPTDGGTGSDSSGEPDPSDAGDGIDQPGNRRPALHRRSYREKPCSQPADQARSGHPRAGGCNRP